LVIESYQATYKAGVLVELSFELATRYIETLVT